MVSRAQNKPETNPADETENLDELLLLVVQSVCNNHGIRIPWDKVAETLGHHATEGAIVQHLAKLRTRRIAAGKDVPPPLRRGGNGPGTASGTAGTTGNAGTGSATTAITGSKAKSSRKRKAEEVDSDEFESELEDVTSDEETPKPRNSRKAKTGVKEEYDDEADAEGEPDASSLVSGEAGNPNEMLVSGAPFLTYSNAQGQAVQDGSKVVTLKYRRHLAPFGAGPNSIEAPAPIVSHPEHYTYGQEYVAHPSADNTDAGMLMGNHAYTTPFHAYDALPGYHPNELNFLPAGNMIDPQLLSHHTPAHQMGFDEETDAYPFNSFQELLDGYEYPGDMSQGQDQGNVGFEDPTLL